MIKYIIYYCLSTTTYGGMPSQNDAFGRPTGIFYAVAIAHTTKECGLKKEFIDKEQANKFYEICKTSRDVDSLRFETVKIEVIK